MVALDSQLPVPSTQTEALLARARAVIPNGDSSTMRVLPYALPFIAHRGEGCRIFDVDGAEYLDLNMAYGPLLFGHRAPAVVRRVREQLEERGSQLGFQSEIGIRTAEKVQRVFPGMEHLRFANSGTEAVASAVRLARANTGRSIIVMFEGHYHGWSEAVFNKYHAPLDAIPYEEFGPALPGTSGMNGGPRDVIVCRFNQPEMFERCMAAHAGKVAAVLMEPVMGNGGVIAPRPGFLQHVKDVAHAHGALLIFDEVITGMRVAPGGGQELYGVRPDITVISKVLGGGFPVSAFGASRDLMNVIVSGKMFHGGVFSANALSMAAAEAMLDEVIERPREIYGHLAQVSEQLSRGVGDILTRHRIPHVIQGVGALISVFLTDGAEQLLEYRDVRRHCQFETYIKLQHGAQRAGVYFHPNQFEPWFPSTAHTAKDIDAVLSRLERVVECLDR
ncbi:MAG: aspartate aminotransferase family protein [Kofleriaceae bacterium]